MRLTASLAGLACILLPGCASAQTAAEQVPLSVQLETGESASGRDSLSRPSDLEIPALNDFCATQMTSLAGGTLSGRHQLFVLLSEAGRGADEDLIDVLDAYGVGQVDPSTPLLQVVEDIANPVLLQAAPNATVGQMAHLIRFSQECGLILDGQIAALEATSPDLANGVYKQAIGEDAIFLRSMLLDALYRLNADSDPVHGQAVAAYQRDLVGQRDDIEFAAFDAELAALEEEFTGDLDKRLDLANTSIGETAGAIDAKGAAEVARALTDVQRAEANARMAQIMIEVLGDYSYGYP
jgi:hypothetical protein